MSQFFAVDRRVKINLESAFTNLLPFAEVGCFWLVLEICNRKQRRHGCFLSECQLSKRCMETKGREKNEQTWDGPVQTSTEEMVGEK